MKYTIRIQPSGMEFTASDDASILQCAIDSNIYLEHSCMDGSCGSCKAKVLKGKVTGQPSGGGLSVSEVNDGYILTCSAQAKSNIELMVNYYPELSGLKRTVQPCKVDSLTFPADDVLVLKLKLPPTVKFRYLAGQYLQLIINGERRSYSIANIEDSNNFIELHVRKVESGKFSEILFNQLKVQQLLRLEGPYGTFFVRQSDAPVIFLAGGTGFAPVKAMIEQLLHDKTDREIFVYWGSSSSTGFYSQLPDVWEKQRDITRYLPVFSGKGDWNGRKGLVHEAVLEDFSGLKQFHVYACGSQEMIRAAQSGFVEKGLLAENFHFDAFVSS